MSTELPSPDNSTGPLFPKPAYGTSAGKTKKKELPEGLFTKCEGCGEMLFNKELAANGMVCKHCGQHYQISAKERLRLFLDEGSWEEFDREIISYDVLNFTSIQSYGDRLKAYRKKTGLPDTVQSGLGRVHGFGVSVAVMDYSFFSGSMGSAAGEKLTRAIERGTEKGWPVIIFCASGGARVHEGLFSLMQLAKTSGALQRHQAAGLPYLSILTNPTLAGVMASFATLGDLIISEPKAMIGFAGARVIKQTTQQDLPKGFQTAEFLLDRGLIDMIVPRPQMRATIAKVLDYLTLGNAKKCRPAAAKQKKAVEVAVVE